MCAECPSRSRTSASQWRGAAATGATSCSVFVTRGNLPIAGDGRMSAGRWWFRGNPLRERRDVGRAVAAAAADQPHPGREPARDDEDAAAGKDGVRRVERLARARQVTADRVAEPGGQADLVEEVDEHLGL